MGCIGMLWQLEDVPKKDQDYHIQQQVQGAIDHFREEFKVEIKVVEVNTKIFREVFKGNRSFHELPIQGIDDVFPNQVRLAFDEEMEDLVNKKRKERYENGTR